MRIIAGEFGGRKLTPPTNMKTRPTTDRVRESIFSALISRLGSFESVNVLDAFGGSGALGLEALSRGAQSCCFFEKDVRAAKVLKSNIKSLGLCNQRAKLFTQDIFQAASRGSIAQDAFNLILLDPPYAYLPSQIATLLNDLYSQSLIAQNAVIMYEHASESSAEVDSCFAEYAFLEGDGCRSFGSTIISYFIVNE